MKQQRKDSGGGRVISLMSRLATAVRMDGWENVFTGLGTTARDKARATRHVPGMRLNDQQLENLYADDDMAARICDTVPDEMLRKGFEVRLSPGENENEVEVEDVSETQTAINNQHAELLTQKKFIDGMVWGRLFGGGAILIGANDGATREGMREPLNEKRIRRIESLNVIEKPYLQVQDWYEDPMEAKYGEPKTYLVIPATNVAQAGVEQLVIHESRMIVFYGQRATVQRRQELDGWSDSVLQRVHEVLKDFNMGWLGVGNLLTDAAQGVLKIKGLIEQISAGRTDVIQRRMTLMDMNRSVARALALDADGEEFERQKYEFGNVDKVLQMFILRLSAAARMPATILMGQSPAGMNATGESDFRWFYDTISTARENDLKPKLERLTELMFLAKEGPTKGKLPENWEIYFPPLWEMTPKEESEVRKNMAETDSKYIQDGVLLPEEVATSRFPPTGYSMETQIDVEMRQLALQAEKERAERKLMEEEDDEPPEIEPPVPTPPLPPVQGAEGQPAPAPGTPTPPPPAAPPEE